MVYVVKNNQTDTIAVGNNFVQFKIRIEFEAELIHYMIDSRSPMVVYYTVWFCSRFRWMTKDLWLALDGFKMLQLFQEQVTFQ